MVQKLVPPWNYSTDISAIAATFCISAPPSKPPPQSEPIEKKIPSMRKWDTAVKVERVHPHPVHHDDDDDDDEEDEHYVGEDKKIIFLIWGNLYCR